MSVVVEAERLAHDHVFLGSAHDDNARRTLWVVALTAVMMIGEIIAGYLTGSMALPSGRMRKSEPGKVTGFASFGPVMGPPGQPRPK